MSDFLLYDLKVAVLIIVFYMFYRLMLSRETFHRVNRIVLLLTAIASFVLPLCVITTHQTVAVAMPEVAIGDVQAQIAPESETEQPLWLVVLPVLYIIGMVATLGNTLLSLARVWQLIRRSERYPQPDGTILCVTGNAAVAPFSWMHYIVMNQSDYEAHDAAILAHERGHIRLRHSLDVVLVDLLTALQWFNPAMWMLRQDLRASHEYEADGEVLSQGINARQYQYLLISKAASKRVESGSVFSLFRAEADSPLGKAASIGGYSIANGISHSTLKNRIHMMTNRKSKSSHLLKLLALLPIIGAALALNARTVTDYIYNKPQDQQSVSTQQSSHSTINQGFEAQEAESTLSAQEDGKTFKMRGIVKDKEKGEPIVGAIIQIGNSKAGTVTDMNGEFSIDVKKGDAVAAAYIGYASDVIVVKEPQDRYVFVLQKDGSAELEKTYDVVEQMPQFPGGSAAMIQYLSKNVHYPEEAFKNGIQGHVIASFTVEKDGSISGAHIVKSVAPQLDAEALRVVNSMPNWTPGMQDGKPVAVRYTVPITFKLDKEEKPAAKNVVLGKEHKGKEFDVVVDGRVVDAEDLNNIEPDNIESMKVEKAKDDTQKDKLILTLKKKK